ncbi:MAG TPA: ABC transporter substrate-binding protein [Chloroflexota bacterium]|nr:ABC transporter substrate-binding protein [Chloroflexota bacterium]HZU07755.1 ABC transporter substrate-binding protein [Chloroflexota bacterium]
MRYAALSRRRLLRLAVLAAGAMALGGCRESERAPGTAPGPAGAAPPVEGPRKLRFGFSGVFDITKLPYPIALARLRAQGYEFETVFLDSAVVTFKALIAGELDLGEGAVGAAIQANQAAGGGDRLRVFCSMNPLTDYVIVTAPDITSLEGLVGRRIGVARLGSISHFVPRVVLQRSGIDPDAVEWIAVGGTTARRAALYSGAIVGGAMHIEEALLTQRDGFNIIFEAAKVMPEYIANGLVAKDSFIRAYPGVIQQITNAMIDAARWVQDNREEAIAFAQRELGSEADLTLLGMAYDTMARIRGWGVNGGLTPENMTATMLEELEMKTIEQPMPWEEWATLEFVNRYLAERGLYRS